jgi:hypothetical protein
MKVLSVALAALALLVGGLAMPSSASAAPYPHSVPTTCRAVAKPSLVRAGTRPAVAFKIKVAGNAHPRSRVFVKAVNVKTHQVKWITVRPYPGHRVIWLLKRLPVGSYKIKYRTSFASLSVYKDCRASYKIRVVS